MRTASDMTLCVSVCVGIFVLIFEILRIRTVASFINSYHLSLHNFPLSESVNRNLTRIYLCLLCFLPVFHSSNEHFRFCCCR